jgi:hypothetical protein
MILPEHCLFIGDGRGEIRCVDCGHRLFDVESRGCPKRRRAGVADVLTLALFAILAGGAIWGVVEILLMSRGGR